MRAILAKGSLDQHKSKLLSKYSFQLVMDIYGTPQDFADIISRYDEKEFKITIGKEKEEE